MKHTFLLTTLLLFVTTASVSQQREIDSLETLLQSHKNLDTLRMSLLTQRAMRYSFMDAEKGLKFVDENIILAKKIKSYRHLAKSYNCKAFCYASLGKDSLAIYWYTEAYRLAGTIREINAETAALNGLGAIYYSRSEYRKALYYRLRLLKIAKNQEPIKKARALNNIGVVYLGLADFRKSTDYFFSALKCANDSGNVDFTGNVYQNIALVYKNIGDFNRSMNYSRKAEATFRKVDDKQALGSCLGNMASAYDDAGNPKKALELYMQALAIARQIKDKRLEASNLTNIGIVYNGLKDYEKAYFYLKRAKEIYDETQNINAMSIVLSELSLLYLNCSEITLKNIGIKPEARYAKAEAAGTEALKMIREIGSADKEAFIQDKLSQIYERQGKFEKALTAFKAYESLNDSIISSEAKDEIARKEIQYEANKKQAVADAEIQRQKVIKYATAASSGVVLLGGIFLFIGYRNRRNAREIQKELLHKAKISDTEMRILRLQMNPHFIFNSLNSISDYIGKNDIKTADYYLLKFAKLMRGILESSEEKEIPLADELKMLELYMQLEASRLNNKFNYEIKVDADIDAAITMVPPLILQPFVENSIWHGMGNKDGKGKIIIEVTRNDMMLNCIVEDDGVGRGNAGKPTGKSRGMKITRDRIEMLNKLQNANASVNLVDLEKGTRVEVSLPLYEEEI